MTIKFFLISATLLTLTSCCGCPDKPHTAMTENTAVTTGLSCSTAKVSGMHCEACAVTVSENLKKLSGVKNAEVDVASGTVKIFTNKESTVTAKQVKSVVEKSGYQFQSLTANCK